MAEPLTHIIRPELPDEVPLYRDDITAPRFTPRELRIVRDGFGKSLTELLVDEASDEKYTALAFLKLRRDYPGMTLDDIDDMVIAIRFTEGMPLDPQTGLLVPTSQGSATTGE